MGKRLTPLVILITLSAVLLTSCGEFGPKFTKTYYFAEYSKCPGVHITEGFVVDSAYEPIGTLAVVETSGYVSDEKWAEWEADDSINELYKGKKSKWRYASANSLLGSVSFLVKEYGGDGLLNFRVEPYNASPEAPGLKITGMVVRKRK